MGAQSLWIEKVTHGYDPEIEYELNYLREYYKTSIKTEAYKLYFIREKISNNGKVDLRKITFLSCSAIVNYSSKNNSDSYLLYSVTALPKKHQFIKDKSIPLMNYYFHSVKDYPFQFLGPDNEKVKFTIRGAPFFQRNDKTSFCMQAALATMLNNIRPEQELLLPNRINEIYGINFGEEFSMDPKNTVEVIKKLGLYTKRFVFNQRHTKKIFKELLERYDWPPSSLLYPWMESGFPGFIIFYPPLTKGTDKEAFHVVPIIGHTLNTDSWQPEADILYKKQVDLHFRSVSAWVDNFIIHDDNFGMYLCYPTSKLADKEKGIGYLVDFVLFITEEEIKFSPDVLEIDLISLVRDLIDNNRNVAPTNNIWLYRLINEKTPLVSRTLLATKENYIESLGADDSEGNIIPEKTRKKITQQLPNKFWLTEITLPDLYIANKTALISIASELSTGEPCFMRIPKECRYINENGKVESVVLPTKSHYRIFARRNENETFDW
ncbi:MAG: hypothetical protein WC855_12475 [Thermodesulfovibrionales bacterium]